MNSDPAKRILEEYRAKLELNKAFGTMLERLIGDLLRTADIKVQPVSHRIKEEQSLARKLTGGAYGGLADVTDVCGVRVITYFEDDVDRVAAIIEKEFEIDRANSIDKRAAMDPKQFGYLSIHYIVSLPPVRAAMMENVPFRECVAEIQIRSVLQHAWAEIEHDLGYKSAIAIPRDAERQFSRMASLLEVADEGFVALRERLSDYEFEVQAKIEDKSSELLIDAVSIKALIDSDGNIQEIDQFLSERIHGPLVENSPEFPNWQAVAASHVGFRTVEEIKTGVKGNVERLTRFGVAYFEALPSYHPRLVARGFSLAAFLVVTAMEKGGLPFVEEAYPFLKKQKGSIMVVENLVAVQTAYDSLKNQ